MPWRNLCMEKQNAMEKLVQCISLDVSLRSALAGITKGGDLAHLSKRRSDLAIIHFANITSLQSIAHAFRDGGHKWTMQTKRVKMGLASLKGSPCTQLLKLDLGMDPSTKRRVFQRTKTRHGYHKERMTQPYNPRCRSSRADR